MTVRMTVSLSYTILCLEFLLIQETELVTFNNPGTVYLNENDDSGQTLWTVSAECYTSNDDSYPNGTLTGTTTSHTVACESCTISSNPDSGLFTMSGNAVYKSACSDTDCGNCPSCVACSTSNGCFTGAETYNIDVYCETTSYDNNDSGTSTLTVSVTSETPTLTISLPGSVNADNSMSVNTVLTRASTSTGLAIVEYTKSSAVASTYQLNTANMFELNTANGKVYVATDPSVEFDYTYSMGICIFSRRQVSCATLTINFDGCFQTPNCNDQTNNGFSDQFAIGDTLFTMTYNKPTDHFTAISPTWQNLTFAKVASTLTVASIDSKTGVISTTGNVTVWPDYPNSTHTFVVEVTNPGHSCSYSSMCTMSMQFSFTNWNISFVSLPATICVHEDSDSRIPVHNVITYDYNNPQHDNVTCTVVSNEDPSLLDLTHSGSFTSDGSWAIHKKVCQDSSCGYIEEGFLCDTGIGCLNYDLDKEYNITIQCSDAYGSSDTAVFTLCVVQNQAPSFTNTPTTITLNANNVTHLDKVFSVYYSDAEFETLDYNFTITPASPSLFEFGDRGNYHGEPVNVIANVAQWNRTNTSFAVSFCGRERRNIVCSSFDIDIREYCGPTPVCSDNTTTLTDQFAVGAELFQIDVTGSGYTSLSYGIISEHSNLFSVNQLTGSVTSAATLEARFPPNSTTYSITANVYDTAACAFATCSGHIYQLFFEIVSKENPGFDYDVADTYTVVVVCEDNYDSSDTATATVIILENQVPTVDTPNVVVWLVSGVAGAVIVVAFGLAICVWRLKRKVRLLKDARNDRNDSDNTQAAQPNNRIEEIELAGVHHYEGIQINGDQENDAHQQVTPSHYIDIDIDPEGQGRNVDEYLHPISSDIGSERNYSSNTQSTQPNDRPDRNEEIELPGVPHYEGIQINGDQEHVYDAHQHVILPQNVDIVINADDQGEGEDGYLHPISSGTAAERSDDYH